ncbi:MAG: S24/S26 family peptidase [Oscillospiraceae bacterium]|nr:S24/S26 family peptidase [Oscillospiraceae bacterium]
MNKNKQSKPYRRLRAVTIFLRLIVVFSLILTLFLLGTVGYGLWQGDGKLDNMRVLGHQVIIQRGDAMLPEIKERALLIVNTQSFEVQRDDIIAYVCTPGTSPVISRVCRIDEAYIVCPDNRAADQQQVVFDEQVMGVVLGYFDIFPRPVGVWNWASPILGDILLEETVIDDEENVTTLSSINITQAVKWSLIFAAPLAALLVLWAVLETKLSRRKKEELERMNPEDFFSATMTPALPPEMMPILKTAPDGQPVAVFEPPLSINIPDKLGFPMAPLNEGIRRNVPIIEPESPAKEMKQTEEMKKPVTIPPVPIPTEQTPITGELMTDDEFAQMLRQFEQDFLS